MFIYILELCSSLFLSNVGSKLSPLTNEKWEDFDELRIAGIILLGIMFLQEFWMWISKLQLQSSTSPLLVPGATAGASEASSQIPPVHVSTSAPLNLKAAPTNKSRIDESLFLSPKKKRDDKNQQLQLQRQPPSSSERITRSKSKRESIGTAAMNGLGGLSLGGDAGVGGGMGGLGGGMGGGLGGELGGGMRSRRR